MKNIKDGNKGAAKTINNVDILSPKAAEKVLNNQK